MGKYNEMMEYYKAGSVQMDEVKEKQYARCKSVQESAKKAIHDAFQGFVGGLEDKVRDWTEDDFEAFMETSQHDDRLSAEDCLTIVTAYKKTHPGSVHKVSDESVALAMLAMGIANLLR